MLAQLVANQRHAPHSSPAVCQLTGIGGKPPVHTKTVPTDVQPADEPISGNHPPVCSNIFMPVSGHAAAPSSPHVLTSVAIFGMDNPAREQFRELSAKATNYLNCPGGPFERKVG